MITIKDLINEPNPRFDENYRIPNTSYKIWLSTWRGYVIWNGEESLPGDYETLQDAVDAYNSSLTQVLPADTDIIDRHKIE